MAFNRYMRYMRCAMSVATVIRIMNNNNHEIIKWKAIKWADSGFVWRQKCRNGICDALEYVADDKRYTPSFFPIALLCSALVCSALLCSDQLQWYRVFSADEFYSLRFWGVFFHGNYYCDKFTNYSARKSSKQLSTAARLLISTQIFVYDFQNIISMQCTHTPTGLCVPFSICACDVYV